MTRTAPAGIREQLRAVVESRGFGLTITAVIIVNALTLGLETWPPAMAAAGPYLLAIDSAALWIFTFELGLKLWVYRGRFFGDAWNVFDLAIVAVAWVPSAGPLSVLRALRIMRVLRLLSVVPQMRTVVGALFRALPGMGSVVAVLALVFYVAAVMATKLFGAAFPEWFGSIGAGLYHFDGESFTNITTSNGLANDRVHCLYEDSAGRIWVGTNGGISIYDPTATTFGDSTMFDNLAMDEGLTNLDVN